MTTSAVSLPLLPKASVTEQVWFPESIECIEDFVSAGVLPASTKQLPVQVEVHW